MNVVTRFAPSPTGELHIGGARTALFNWLYARHMGGKFLLRIEDTDKERSLQVHTDEILEKLKWVGLDWDGEVVHQSNNIKRHAEIAHKLVENGNAYFCYASPDELNAMREFQRINKLPYKYDHRWRDKDPSLAPVGVAPVIRLKMPLTGKITINDAVQGPVTVDNSTLDDMILLRADGTPTYMLSVVVDDYDMKVTHIIRGDDHLNNAFRQLQLIKAMGWNEPIYAHVPLIHSETGKKFTKREGSPGIEYYKELGFLPEAIRNYLLRLGWGSGDSEILTTTKAIDLFDLPGIGKAAARFDMKKLKSINSHYMRETPWNDLLERILPLIELKINRTISTIELGYLVKGFNSVRLRSTTLVELANNLEFYVNPNISDTVIITPEMIWLRAHAVNALKLCNTNWTHDNFEPIIREYCIANNIEFKDLVQTTRKLITGSNISPSMFEIFDILGYDETVSRLSK